MRPVPSVRPVRLVWLAQSAQSAQSAGPAQSAQSAGPAERTAGRQLDLPDPADSVASVDFSIAGLVAAAESAGAPNL